MKKYLILYILAIYSLSSVAQDKAMLTKDETINYISRKLKEVAGYIKYKRPDGTGGEISNISATNSSTGIEITFHISQVDHTTGSYTPAYTRTYSFNPAYIKDISYDSQGDEQPVHLLNLNFKANFVREQDYTPKWKETETNNLNTTNIPFLNIDGENFNKLKKAFLHLRDLYKAEEDPFGE